ncbi:Rgp1-domain-containing protein [Dipodascopsis tothii]|uniref:Rgp1-domain-containing protein n=1 Tax=Dipodascopsis tothii TaxID=44089 RepID=UPI0034CF717E
MASAAQSHLRVEVAFSDPVYFAGEQLECTITFRNTAAPPELARKSTGSGRARKISQFASEARPPVEQSMRIVSQNGHAVASDSLLKPSYTNHSGDGLPSAPGSGAATPSPSISPISSTLSLSALANKARRVSADLASGGADMQAQRSSVSMHSAFSDKSGGSVASPAAPSLARRASYKVPKTWQGETIIMGYAQITGTFALDETLVKSAAFNEARTRSIMGGNMGGGVVGLGAGKIESESLWGMSLSGLSSFLGGSETSSIAEMKSHVSADGIAILSTPQSLMFVNLLLNPGEAKSFLYKFPLPKTLPPSYRGKALKINYDLVIGTQRDGKVVQPLKVTKAPFRVFQNIDEGGNQAIHSLTSPIVFLKDKAIITPLDDAPLDVSSRKNSSASLNVLKSTNTQTDKEREESLRDFMAYTQTLLEFKPSATHEDMRPPSPIPSPGFQSVPSHQIRKYSFRQSVDLAVQRNSLSAYGNTLNSVFEIARNSRKIASLVLSRPAYKLGDAVVFILDFDASVLPCYHVTASLETTEVIDAHVALRPASFNERATRKIYSQSSFTALVGRRASFSFCIPTTATPQFSTSYISSSWSLRLEFVTTPAEHAPKRESMALDTRADDSPPNTPTAQSLDFDRRHSRALSRLSLSSTASQLSAPPKPDLLDCVHRDDRTRLFAATEVLSSEKFECRIPLKVFPASQDLAAMSFQMQPYGGYVI